MDKFSFFEADGKIGSDFKAVYDLHMRIEALSKTLTFYDMKDVFQILPEDIIEALEYQFQLMFTCQADLDEVEDRLRTYGTNANLLTDQRLAQLVVQSSIDAVDGIDIHPFDLLDNFKGIDESIIRRSSAYYSQYGAEYTV